MEFPLIFFFFNSKQLQLHLSENLGELFGNVRLSVEIRQARWSFRGWTIYIRDMWVPHSRSNTYSCAIHSTYSLSSASISRSGRHYVCTMRSSHDASCEATRLLYWQICNKQPRYYKDIRILQLYRMTSELRIHIHSRIPINYENTKSW